MSVVLGKNVFIYAGQTGTTPIIAASKSCTISRKVDLYEKASSTQSTAKEFITGRSEWEVTLSHLVVSDAPFDGILKVGSSYTLSMVIGSTRKYGTAICVQADLSAPVGNLATGSVKFKGTGDLT